MADEVTDDFTGGDGTGTATGTLATSLGTLAGSFLGGPGSPPVDPQASYTPPAQAWRAGNDNQGNPLFQLKDDAGNIIQWAINTAGAAVDYRNLGAAGVVAATGNPQYSYTAPAGARSAGTDTSGNPLYQLVDEAGNVIQWAINAAGQATDYKNLGQANQGTLSTQGNQPSTGPVVAAGPSGGPAPSAAAGTPKTGTGGLMQGGGNPATNILNTLSNVLTGNNAPTGLAGGTIIAPNTFSPTKTTTTLASDSSNRSTTNVANNYNVNSDTVFNSLVDLVKGLAGTKASAASSKPFNDASQRRGMANPSFFSAGQTINSGMSQPGTTTPAAATLLGKISTPSSDAQTKWIIAGVALAVLSLLVLLFRRGR